MRFTDWCKAQGIELAEAGRQVGVEKRQTMWKYATGKIKAPPELIVKCENFSGGAVRAVDWIFESEKAA